MISVNTAYNLGRNNKFFTELAISNHNDNLYNKSSDGLKGIAIKSGFVTREKKIGFLPGYLNLNTPLCLNKFAFNWLYNDYP